MLSDRRCPNLGKTLVTRLQLCGSLVIRLDGHRVEARLPGRLGRLLVVYLVVHRRREVPRSELLSALWPDEPPTAADTSLSALLSKIRRTVGPERLEGRASLRLRLPRDAWVDLEAAAEGIHRAESALARGDWFGVYGPGRVAQHVTMRTFLPGEDAPWVVEVRSSLDETHVRSLELVGLACIEIGGSELNTADRCARRLVELAPYRESGYRLLMRVRAAQGNPAESLLVYDELRRRLHDDLGAVPSAGTLELYRSLL
jgi:DNA-binding SARP family transcriptional activator